MGMALPIIWKKWVPPVEGLYYIVLRKNGERFLCQYQGKYYENGCWTIGTSINTEQVPVLRTDKWISVDDAYDILFPDNKE